MARKTKKSAHQISLNPYAESPASFQPPRFRYLFGIVAITEVLLVLWAIANQFIAYPTWYSLAFNINIALTILGVAFLIYAYRLNPNALDTTHAGVKKWIGLLCAPVLLFFMGYVAIIYGLGDVLTQLQGHAALKQDVFEKRFVESRKSCQTRLYGYTLQESLPKYFCTHADVFAKLPKHVAVDIHGLESGAGFHIERIEFDWLKTAFLPKEN